MTTLKTQDIQVKPKKIDQQTRAALFNIVAFAPNSSSLDRIKGIIHSIGFRFPCRLIIIELDESIGSLKMETVPCPSEERQKTYPQLNIKTSSADLEKVPFVVLPNLISDVPVYLIWGQDPTTDTKILPHFQDFATRIIFDSSSTQDLGAFAQRMYDQVSSGNNNLLDISWALISGWRDVIARIYNDPSSIEELTTCKKITIGCRRSDDYAAGVYLFSWIASRLGWKFIRSNLSEGSLELTYENEGKDINAIIASDKSSDSKETGISTIEVITKNDDVYRMTHRSPSRTVVTHIMRANTCSLPITLPFACLNRSQALLRELLHQQPGEHYRHMLSKLVHHSHQL